MTLEVMIFSLCRYVPLPVNPGCISDYKYFLISGTRQAHHISGLLRDNNELETCYNVSSSHHASTDTFADTGPGQLSSATRTNNRCFEIRHQNIVSNEKTHTNLHNLRQTSCNSKTNRYKDNFV